MYNRVEDNTGGGHGAGGEDLPRRGVLIVDDEKGIRDLFSAILSHDLPEVPLDLASNGEEALERFRRGRHGVLIMDLHMPIMDGLTAFNRIEQLCAAETEKMPAVVFCTGFAPPDSVREIVQTCSRHCLLPKPVRNEVLVETIRGRLA